MLLFISQAFELLIEIHSHEYKWPRIAGKLGGHRSNTCYLSVLCPSPLPKLNHTYSCTHKKRSLWSLTCVHTDTNTYTYTHACACTHTHVHMCMYTHTHTHTYTHTHTCTYTHTHHSQHNLLVGTSWICLCPTRCIFAAGGPFSKLFMSRGRFICWNMVSGGCSMLATAVLPPSMSRMFRFGGWGVSSNRSSVLGLKTCSVFPKSLKRGQEWCDKLLNAQNDW